MCYAATHPEKLDAAKQAQWQKLARLRPEDMATVVNLEFLGVPVRKRGKASGLVFGRKRKRAVRKVRGVPCGSCKRCERRGRRAASLLPHLTWPSLIKL